MEMYSITELSVRSISGTTFIVDIKYGIGAGISMARDYEKATVKIEKTEDSYKIISYDRYKRFF